MIMISIVICLALEMYSTWASQHRNYDWADTLANYLKKVLGDGSLWHSPWGVVAVLFVPLFVLGVIQNMLNNVWLSVVELLLSVAVLLYCLRYQPMVTQVDELVAALKNNDQQKAQQMSAAILEEPSSEISVEKITDTLLVNANERLFAVLIWFAILGPLGALLYRLSWYYSEASLHANSDFGLSMHRLHALLNWLPARLLASSYAVVGSFEETIHGWRKVYDHPPEDRDALNHAIMLSAGRHALNLPAYQFDNVDDNPDMDVKVIEAAHGLVLRSMLAWGIVIAVFTLVGWST